MKSLRITKNCRKPNKHRAIRKPSEKTNGEITLPAGCQRVSLRRSNLDIRDWRTTMIDDTNIQDIETSVLLLGLGYAATLVTLILWIAG